MSAKYKEIQFGSRKERILDKTETNYKYVLAHKNRLADAPNIDAHLFDYIPAAIAECVLIRDNISRQVCRYWVRKYTQEFPLLGVEGIIKYPNSVFIAVHYGDPNVYGYISYQLRYCRGPYHAIFTYDYTKWHHTKICGFENHENFTSKWKLL